MADRRSWALVSAVVLAIGAPPPASAQPQGSVPVVADAADNRMLAFPAVGPAPQDEETGSARHCAAGRTWCAELRRGESGGWRLELAEGGGRARAIALDGDADAESFALWPHLVREAGGAVLVGVLRTYRTGFSGGGARRTALLLVRAEPGGGAPALLLDIPLSGSAMIRACFAEADEGARAGACHDEYALAGTLRLDPATAAGRPRFILTAAARTYPGRRSRSQEAPAAAQLRRSDLVWAPDPACTYRRALAFDPAAGRYQPDSPLPDCPDYFDF